MMRKVGVWASLAISMAGVLLVAIFLSRPGSTGSAGGGLLAWAVFSSICVLGAAATVFPHHCSLSIALPDNLDESRFTVLKGVRFVHGHHPACGEFGGHELAFRGKSFCAGCTGLLIGSVSAVALATLYFVYDHRLPTVSGYFGLVFVILGLLYNIPLEGGPPLLRTALNVLFVIGFALILVSVDGAGDIGVDLFAIGLFVYWMFTRIQISRWRHDRICRGCDEPCEKKVV